MLKHVMTWKRPEARTRKISKGRGQIFTYISEADQSDARSRNEDFRKVKAFGQSNWNEIRENQVLEMTHLQKNDSLTWKILREAQR